MVIRNIKTILKNQTNLIPFCKLISQNMLDPNLCSKPLNLHTKHVRRLHCSLWVGGGGVYVMCYFMAPHHVPGSEGQII